MIAIGTALRLVRFDVGLWGDELSTLYLVSGGGLDDAISNVSSDAEISPPLYFVLAWFTTQLGDAPELVRLPSMIAGVISIGLVYLVGRRLVSVTAGVIAAAVMALNPFMIFYSADGRAYAVAIALLLGSTLAMLWAAREGRFAAWATYAALSCLAVYTHYTAAFVLAVQLAWLLWTHPECRRAALVANVAAVLAFVPWVPSLLADLDSPTTEILEALQGDGFAVKREATEIWAFGLPYQSSAKVPGQLALALGIGGIALAAIAGFVRWWRARPRAVAPGMVLAIGLALATPVAEGLLLLLGTDLYGARNLTLSSGGLAVAVGALVASAGPLLGAICGAAAIAAFAIGAARTLEAEHTVFDFEAAAEFIDREAGPDEIVVDLSSVDGTPVPLTSLDAYLPQGRPEYRINLPQGEPPFLPLTPIPPPDRELADAFARAAGSRLFIVGFDHRIVGEEGGPLESLNAQRPTEEPVVFEPPPGTRIVERVSYPGIQNVDVAVVEVPPQASRSGKKPQPTS